MKFYNRQGKQIDIIAWSETCNDVEARRVGLAELPGGVSVSTVLLGTELGRDDAGRPLIFETMVSTQGDDGMGVYEQRYATEADALAGHRETLRRVLAGELET